MASTDIAIEFPNLIRVHKDGGVHRLRDDDFLPPSTHHQTGVVSKDVSIPNDPNIVSTRLYLPKIPDPKRKLPLLVYFHGGAFCVGSPFTAKYHNFLNAVVSEANVVAVSIGYRRAPENDVTDAYDDASAGLLWVGLHREGNGPDPWLNLHADFDRVFLAGDSAGANIAHNMTIFAGYDTSFGFDILGLALIHPYFWGSDPIGSEAADPERKALIDRIWPFVCKSNPNNDDTRVNPFADGAPNLAGLACRRLLVLVAERDILRDRGRMYFDVVSRSGWFGVAEVFETEEEDHLFHLKDPESERAKSLRKELVDFFARDMPPLL